MRAHEPSDHPAHRRRAGFAALRAVRLGRVHLIDEQLVSRPTLRLLQGIARIQSLLYPNLAGIAQTESGS